MSIPQTGNVPVGLEHEDGLPIVTSSHEASRQALRLFGFGPLALDGGPVAAFGTLEILVQSGVAFLVADAGGLANFTFPFPFPSRILSINATPFGGSGGAVATVIINSFTLAGVQFKFSVGGQTYETSITAVGA